jgi:hypothetical protein
MIEVRAHLKRTIVRTGQYGIGTMIHTVHVGRNAIELTGFYQDVFGAVTFLGDEEPTYSPREDRFATLSVISDYCVEVMAPAKPVNAAMPVGKFFTKFGSHLHSVGYAVDDLVGLGNDLIAHGVRIGKPGGGYLERVAPDTDYIFPNPRDTMGILVELAGFNMPGDPRLLDGWNERMTNWQSGPLGIKRLAYQTIGVRDVVAATDRCIELFNASLVAMGHSSAEAATYRIVHLGDGLLRFAQPDGTDSALGRHVEQYGDMIYSVTFCVNDLDEVPRWLSRHNIRSHRLSSDLVAAEPVDTYGAPCLFTTADVPNDPFG